MKILIIDYKYNISHANLENLSSYVHYSFNDKKKTLNYIGPYLPHGYAKSFYYFLQIGYDLTEKWNSKTCRTFLQMSDETAFAVQLTLRNEFIILNCNP